MARRGALPHLLAGTGLCASLLEALADGSQQRVAGGMAEAVVEFLEAVEIEGQHDNLFVCARRGERVFEPFAQMRAVGQVGQGIVARQMCGACFDAPLPRCFLCLIDVAMMIFLSGDRPRIRVRHASARSSRLR